MKHTFLLEEGEWVVKGSYFDAAGKKSPVTGRTKVQHGEDSWVSDGTLTMGEEETPAITNHYDIAPMGDDATFTTWSCMDPTEGTVTGVLHVVDDCVISSFSSETSGYHGVDVLRKAKDEYRSRGFAMRGTDRLSSWTLTVKRPKKAAE